MSPTRVLRVPEGEFPSAAVLSEAVEALSAGEVVGVPSETVYGLAANALEADAVGRIYGIKGRPADNPLIVHVSSLEMLNDVIGDIPPQYSGLINNFWPGPLTLLFNRPIKIPMATTANRDTVAVRLPSHPVFRSLIAECGFPLAAPSANRSTRPSPTSANHVIDDLGSTLRLLIDGGPCSNGLESTVVDGISPAAPVILRPGGITVEQIASIPGWENVRVFRASNDNSPSLPRSLSLPALEQVPTTPGMKYRHYAPTAPVILLYPCPYPSTPDTASDPPIQSLTSLLSPYNSPGLLYHTLTPPPNLPHLHAVHLGSSPTEIARFLFENIRTLDKLCDVIFVQVVDETHHGLAVMNRLKKAASGSVNVTDE